jgi:aminoglycoside phosphotransferase (APT) family kinase protein
MFSLCWRSGRLLSQNQRGRDRPFGCTVIFTQRNLLVSNGDLAGIVDFGLLGVGDPACDLMVAWTYLSADARQVFRDQLAVDDSTWARGRGWALHLGLMAAAFSADNPVLENIGRRAITEVMSDSGRGSARQSTP